MTDKGRSDDRAFEDQTKRLGWGVRELDRICSGHWQGGVELERVKLRLGDTSQIETLVILEGVGDDGTPVVGFHSACPPSEALAGALRRCAAGQIRWRIDDYRIKRATQIGPPGGES